MSLAFVYFYSSLGERTTQTIMQKIADDIMKAPDGQKKDLIDALGALEGPWRPKDLAILISDVYLEVSEEMAAWIRACHGHWMFRNLRVDSDQVDLEIGLVHMRRLWQAAAVVDAQQGALCHSRSL